MNEQKPFRVEVETFPNGDQLSKVIFDDEPREESKSETRRKSTQEGEDNQ